jgi:hypothetical protein
MDPMANPVIALLLRQLDLAFDIRSWHGTNLLGSIRGVERAVVAWRPQRGRHNIAELVVHAAYWKYRVFRLISDAEQRSFELPGSDFFERPGVPTEAQWRADVELLRTWHQRLADAVAAFPAERLSEVPGRSKFSYADVICGAAAHDLYHAGQIQLIKRMHTNR